MQRLMIECKEAWEVRFTHSLTRCLSINEILGLPSYAGKVKWLCGDATPATAAGINWSIEGLPEGILGEVMCFETASYRDALKSMMADSEASLEDLASRLADIADLLDECPSGLPQP